MPTTNAQQPRLLTPNELAMLMKLFREMRQWSQEQLGEISGLSARTIQRVEDGQASSLDTRRALARAFEIEDIDAFNKPYAFPTEDEMKATKEEFDKENITLSALPLTTGKELAAMVEMAAMDLSVPAFELSREADERFAELIDYYRDYRDCAECYLRGNVIERTGYLAVCLQGCRGPLVDLCHLGQEYFYLGPRRLSAPVRTDPVWLDRRRGTLLVR